MIIRLLGESDTQSYKEIRLRALKNDPEAFGSVGIVNFARESRLKTAHKGHIYGMYIDPHCRGRGLGKSLLLALIERATRECVGLEQIHLTVVSNNEAAKRLYISLGFEVYGVEPNALKFDGHYFDEDLMILRLETQSN